MAADPGVREALVEQAARALRAATGWPRAATSAPSSRPTPRSRCSSPPSREERARRRAAELGADPDTVLAEQALRDERDRTREHSPLGPRPGRSSSTPRACRVDEVVERIAGLVAGAGVVKVAVVGYPNVGKSSLVNRLAGSARGGGPRAAGRDPRPQGAARRVERAVLHARGHGRRRPRGPRRARGLDPRAGPRGAGGRGRGRARRRRAGRAAPRRRGAGRPAAPLADPRARRGEQVRRPERRPAGGRVPPPRPRRADRRVGRARPRDRRPARRHRGRASGRRRPRRGRGRGPPRRHRPPQRGQVVARQPVPRPRAGDRVRARRDDARRDRRAPRGRRAGGRARRHRGHPAPVEGRGVGGRVEYYTAAALAPRRRARRRRARRLRRDRRRHRAGPADRRAGDGERLRHRCSRSTSGISRRRISIWSTSAPG